MRKNKRNWSRGQRKKGVIEWEWNGRMDGLVCTSTITRTLMVRMIDDSSRDWGKARSSEGKEGYKSRGPRKGSVCCAGGSTVLLLRSVHKHRPCIFSSYWLALLARDRRGTKAWPLSTEAIFIPPGEGWWTVIQTPFIRRGKSRKKKKKGKKRRRGR